jgi:hypothetical protein
VEESEGRNTTTTRNLRVKRRHRTDIKTGGWWKGYRRSRDARSAEPPVFPPAEHGLKNVHPVMLDPKVARKGVTEQGSLCEMPAMPFPSSPRRVPGWVAPVSPRTPTSPVASPACYTVRIDASGGGRGPLGTAKDEAPNGQGLGPTVDVVPWLSEDTFSAFRHTGS